MGNRFFPNYDKYIITSPFGMRIHPVTKVKKMHNGIDLVATNNGKTGQVDDIMAHTGGTVYAVGYGDSAGNYIKIKVADGSIMVYYHLEAKPKFKKGDVIKTGQVIGRMGKSGSVTGKHLHWGIQKDGKWIDPKPYLDKDYIVAAKSVTIEMNVLKKGAKGEQVESLQTLLNLRLSKKLGDKFVPLDVDGSFGAKTLAAVKQFQELYGLAVDGSVGSATWNKLLKG